MPSALLENSGAVSVEDPVTISQDAQDVAKAQGVAYEDIAQEQETQATTDVDYKDYNAEKVSSTLDQNVLFKEPSSYIDEAKSTVAGQLSTILGSNSPYIKQAEQQAREQSAGRGLLNSTLAAQAGRTAAIGAAMPIAQQDAQTYASFASRQQQADYNLNTIQSEAIISAEMVEQKANIERVNTSIQNAFSSRIQGASAQDQSWLTDLQNTYNEGMQALEIAGQKLLLETELDYKQAEAVQQHATDILMNYQVTIENWMNDPDFLGLGKDAVNNAINQLNTLARNSINFIGSAAGLDLSPFIDAYLKDLTVYQ